MGNIPRPAPGPIRDFSGSVVIERDGIKGAGLRSGRFATLRSLGSPEDSLKVESCDVEGSGLCSGCERSTHKMSGSKEIVLFETQLTANERSNFKLRPLRIELRTVPPHD